VLARDALRGGWDNFWNALSLPAAAAALVFSLWTAALAAAVNAVLGTATAYTLVRAEFPGRRWLSPLADFPLAVPTFAAGAALAARYGPGVFGPVHRIFPSWGVLGATLFVTFPTAVRSVQPLLLAADRGQEDAAASLGASPWDAFRRVLLPQILPGIAA